MMVELGMCFYALDLIYIYIYIYLYIFRLFFFLMILWGETERAIRFVVVMEVGTLDC